MYLDDSNGIQTQNHLVMIIQGAVGQFGLMIECSFTN